MAFFKKKMSSLPQPTIGGVVDLDEKEIARIRADPRQRVYDFEYKDLKPSQKLTAEQALATARKVRARFEALPAGTDRRATLRGEFPDYAYSHEHIFNLITDPGAPPTTGRTWSTWRRCGSAWRTARSGAGRDPARAGVPLQAVRPAE